jgi:FkbM family methyltransferase
MRKIRNCPNSNVVTNLANLILSFINRHNALLNFMAVLFCFLKNYQLKIVNGICILKSKSNSNSILFSREQIHYISELVRDFDFYFNSINLENKNSQVIIDFSKPDFHSIKGWNYFEVHFPSLVEPLETSAQYIEHLRLVPGETIIDLGAYAGLSSMHFMEQVGQNGTVIAVEADQFTLFSTEVNFRNYDRKFGTSPQLLKCAAWSSDTELQFLSEGNIGSSVLGINSRKRFSKLVQAKTLSSIANEFNLKKIDAIKLDIEGAEFEVFKDSEFFSNHKPRIIFEAILAGRKSPPYLKALSLLESYGYSLEIIEQAGSVQKLVLALPILRETPLSIRN